MSEAARERADQSVATHFTRIMNASTSRWGMLTDPPVVAVLTAPPIVALLAAARLDAPGTALTALEVVAALPIAAAIALTLALRGARGRVVAWLAGVPFPVENMNAVLNGLGESLEVTFVERCPTVRELNNELDRVSPEAFVTLSPETAAAAPEGGEKKEPAPVVEIRIGVVDSKRNPAATNHRRYERLREIVARVLVPLAERYPIVEVRVK